MRISEKPKRDSKPVNRPVHHLLLVLLALILALGILEPLQEGLGGLADLLAGRDVHVFLAGLCAPCLEGFLRHEVVLVVAKEDGRDLCDQGRVVLPDKPLGTAQEGLLVALGSDHLLQEKSAVLDLLGDLFIEDALRKHGTGLVLGFDAELLGLHVDVDVADLGDTTLFSGGVDNPTAQLFVGRRTVSPLVVAVLKDQRALEVRGEILGTSLDSLLRHINSPFVVLDLRLSLDGLGLAGQLVIAAGLERFVAVLVTTLGSVAVSRAALMVTVSGVLLLRLTASLLVLLVLLPSLGVVADNEGAQLQTGVDIGTLTAGLAVQGDLVILDVDIGLRVLAFLAEHKLGDEPVKVVLKLPGVVRTVDDPTVISRLGVGLSTELEAEILDDVRRGATEGLGDRVQVDNDGLDTVALALDLGLQALHLVTVEGIGDIPTNVDGSHGDGGIG